MNSQDFNTAEEGSSSEDDFEELRAISAELAKGPNETPEAMKSMNLSQKEILPRYPPGRKNKRGSDSMEPPVDSAQSPKHILYDEQAWLTSPRLNFTPDGQPITRITFLPQRTDRYGNSSTHRAVALRTIPKPSRGRGKKKVAEVVQENAAEASVMDLDECFEYL